MLKEADMDVILKKENEKIKQKINILKEENDGYKKTMGIIREALNEDIKDFQDIIKFWKNIVSTINEVM